MNKIKRSNLDTENHKDNMNQDKGQYQLSQVDDDLSEEQYRVRLEGTPVTALRRTTVTPSSSSCPRKYANSETSRDKSKLTEKIKKNNNKT